MAYCLCFVFDFMIKLKIVLFYNVIIFFFYHFKINNMKKFNFFQNIYLFVFSIYYIIIVIYVINF